LIGLPTGAGGIELQLKIRLCFEKGNLVTAENEADANLDEENVLARKCIEASLPTTTKIRNWIGIAQRPDKKS
jgi:hypothetical protein